MLRKPNMFDIWTAELPMKKGSHIQGGFRPVLVVSNNQCNRHSPVISVIPITSKQKKRKLPTHVALESGGLDYPGTALCEQILLIDKTALRKKLGSLVTEAERAAIQKAMAIQLGLQINYKRSTNMRSLENEELCRSPLMLTMEDFHRAGHSYVSVEELLGRSGMGMEVAALEMDTLIAEDLLHVEENQVSAERVHKAEQNAAMALALRLDNNSVPWEYPLSVAPHLYSREQKDAIQMALSHRLSLILGGAGSGKTTLVGNLLEEFLAHEKGGTLLLAPTGRAAANIQDATFFKACTIHKALLSPSKWENIKLVIVDESSMLDVELLSELLDRCSMSCRIVLVGDPNQLLSVGPGNVLQDLLRTGFPAIILQENHRQKGTQTALRRNVLDFVNIPKTDHFDFDESFCLVEAEDWNIANIVIREVISRYQTGETVQVLTPVNTAGTACVEALNKAVHPIVNPHPENAAYIPNHKDCFWNGDRVLVTQNLKDVGCCNGDIGTLQLYPPERSNAVAALDLLNDKRVYFSSREQLKYLQHGYAMTIHKAQGSAFDTVIIPVSWAMRHMLNRNLLYTAISRAREKVILVGTWEALDYALRTKAPARNSALWERIRWQLSA